MLIEKPKRKESTYYVECANWRSMVNASDETEAATTAFEEALSKYQTHTEISPVATVIDVSSVINDMELGNNLHFVYSPTILANAGMHKRSKSLQYIIENLKNKSS
jgi:hypothetical protein